MKNWQFWLLVAIYSAPVLGAAFFILLIYLGAPSQ